MRTLLQAPSVRRTADTSLRYNPFLRSDKIGVAIGFSDPVYRKQFKQKYGCEIEDDMHNAAADWSATIFPGTSHSWEDIKFLQDHWDGPIVLKGIQNAADAEKAVEAGVRTPNLVYASIPLTHSQRNRSKASWFRTMAADKWTVVPAVSACCRRLSKP